VFRRRLDDGVLGSVGKGVCNVLQLGLVKDVLTSSLAVTDTILVAGSGSLYFRDSESLPGCEPWAGAPPDTVEGGLALVVGRNLAIWEHT
jgi:hypothetical protein